MSGSAIVQSDSRELGGMNKYLILVLEQECPLRFSAGMELVTIATSTD